MRELRKAVKKAADVELYVTEYVSEGKGYIVYRESLWDYQNNWPKAWSMINYADSYLCRHTCDLLDAMEDGTLGSLWNEHARLCGSKKPLVSPPYGYQVSGASRDKMMLEYIKVVRN